MIDTAEGECTCRSSHAYTDLFSADRSDDSRTPPTTRSPMPIDPRHGRPTADPETLRTPEAPVPEPTTRARWTTRPRGDARTGTREDLTTASGTGSSDRATTTRGD